jgi:hypothetical protein
VKDDPEVAFYSDGDALADSAQLGYDAALHR